MEKSNFLSFEWAEQRFQNRSTDLIYFCHLLFSVFFFSNFFLFNQIFIASTDMLCSDFPNLILAKRDFLQGELGLWNPFSSCGMSSSLYALCPIYSPDNWPLFLVPEEYLFCAITLSSVIKLWLLGIFSFHLFYQELGCKKWAFFSSTIYQLSGYTIWTVTAYDTLSLSLYTTISLYLTWTLHKRALYKSYLYLTLAVVMAILSSNIVFAIYAIIVITVLSFYRYISQMNMGYRFQHLLLFFLCMATSILIIMIRLLPFWAELQTTTRVARNFFTMDPRSLSFLSLRLFNPEVFGINLVSSIPVFKSMHVTGTHIHDKAPHFFGVLPALLMLWSFITPQKGRINFWVLYVLITFLSVIVFMEPFDTVARLLMLHSYHPLGMSLFFFPIGFCMLVGYVAKHLEENAESFSLTDRSFWILTFLIITISLYMTTVWAVYYLSVYAEKAVLIRLYIVSFSALVFLIFVTCRQWTGFKTYVPFALSVMGLVAFFYIMMFVDNPNKIYVSHLKNMSASLVMLMLAYLFVLALSLNGIKQKVLYLRLAVPLLIVCLFVMLYPWAGVMTDLPTKPQDLTLAGFGLTRFIIVTVIFVTILTSLSKKRFKAAWLFPLFFSVLLFEQLPAGKIHSHISTNPFYKASTPYPKPSIFIGENGQPINLDTKSYRVNNPNSMLQLPFYRELYGNDEILASIHSIYGIRSYGGYINAISPHYERFARALVPIITDYTPTYFVRGIYANLKDERFLDLCGVGYDHDTDSGLIKERPGALSRIMLFKSYEVIADDKRAFERLKSLDFDYRRVVILDRDPGIPNSNLPKPAKGLQIVGQTSDSVEVCVKSESPAILFFNDTYHEGWRAFLDGKEQLVFPADYNFMATVVPAGESTVVFRFQPKLFYTGLYMTLSGLALFVLVGSILYVTRANLSIKCR